MGGTRISTPTSPAWRPAESGNPRPVLLHPPENAELASQALRIAQWALMAARCRRRGEGSLLRPEPRLVMPSLLPPSFIFHLRPLCLARPARPHLSYLISARPELRIVIAALFAPEPRRNIIMTHDTTRMLPFTIFHSGTGK